jgi:hypothetical protein
VLINAPVVPPQALATALSVQMSTPTFPISATAATMDITEMEHNVNHVQTSARHVPAMQPPARHVQIQMPVSQANARPASTVSMGMVQAAMLVLINAQLVRALPLIVSLAPVSLPISLNTARAAMQVTSETESTVLLAQTNARLAQVLPINAQIVRTRMLI